MRWSSANGERDLNNQSECNPLGEENSEITSPSPPSWGLNNNPTLEKRLATKPTEAERKAGTDFKSIAWKTESGY